MNILKMLDGGTGYCPTLGYAVFQNKDGNTIRLSWEELKLKENGKKYNYANAEIQNKDIGTYAFRLCSNLVSIVIPNSVINISDNAFYYSGHLEQITISDSVKRIGAEAFCGCERLASIKIPSSVTDIGEYAFYGCIDLESVVISDNLKTLGNDVFIYCSRLHSIKYKGQFFETAKEFEAYFRKNNT